MMRKQAANTATKHTLKTLSLTLVIVEVTERVENVRYKGERKWSIPRVGTGRDEGCMGPNEGQRTAVACGRSSEQLQRLFSCTLLVR